MHCAPRLPDADKLAALKSAISSGPSPTVLKVFRAVNTFLLGHLSWSLAKQNEPRMMVSIFRVQKSASMYFEDALQTSLHAESHPPLPRFKTPQPVRSESLTFVRLKICTDGGLRA